MSESLSSPWIRDYFVDVAENYGAQLYNAPVSLKKKKVQLTDYLTYQENSYVWAWISDKDYRVSVRISKDAADSYKSHHGRNIVGCRFSVVVISSYRPMFSPRPLGPNVTGNTTASHISLEIGLVRLIGICGHLFGNPRDLESDESMKEWIFGLRQDGGGGNVLKLRKQQKLAQNETTIQPSPPPFSLYAPVSQCEAAKAIEDTPKPKLEHPRDYNRVYAKRWRIIELNPWKFASDPAAKEPPNQYPTPPCRTPSPIPKPQQPGTPTDWSLSNRGSPVAPDKAATIALGNGFQQHDELEVSSTATHLPFDTDRYPTDDAAVATIPDARSPQPPAPAQRAKHSPPPPTTSPTRSSPEVFAPSYPVLSQQLPSSSPPPPTPSLPLPSSSLPMPMNIRKNIQRKVPHPGFHAALLGPTKQGPVQVLVPNSDTSGMGSSQSYSQSQQLFPHLPAFPSSLPKDFEPPETSTPREGGLGSPTRRASKMLAGPLPTHPDAEEQEAALADDDFCTEKAEINTERQGELDSTRLSVPSVPKVEVLETGTSDTQEDADKLPRTCNVARVEVDFGAHTQGQELSKGGADQEDDHLSVDKVQSTPQGSQPHQPSCLPAASTARRPLSNEQDVDGVSIHHFLESLDPGSQGSMHSLFSVVLEDDGTVSIGRTENKAQEGSNHVHVPRHDSEAWKEPSFLARNRKKGKARAAGKSDTPKIKMDKKRQRSAQLSPPPKRTKVAAEERRVVSGQTTTENTPPQDIEPTASTGKVSSSNQPSTSLPHVAETKPSAAVVQSSKHRLVSFVVDSERVSLGKTVRIPLVKMGKDVRGMLLRTGRIRSLGKEVEKNGSIYIKK